MKIKTYFSAHKTLFTFLTAALIIAAGTLVYGYVNNEENSREKYYSCVYYSDFGNYARCNIVGGTEKYRGGCYGFYYFRGEDIKSGIKVDGNHTATCEGFSAGEEYIFNKTGKYLGVQKSGEY